jgi:hypothetical protein
MHRSRVLSHALSVLVIHAAAAAAYIVHTVKALLSYLHTYTVHYIAPEYVAGRSSSSVV